MQVLRILGLCLLFSWSVTCNHFYGHAIAQLEKLGIASEHDKPVSFEDVNHLMNISTLLENFEHSGYPACENDVIRLKEKAPKKFAKLVDAWGKPSPGLLQGGINWVGKASECREIFVSGQGNLKDIRTQQSLVALKFPKIANLPDIAFQIGACLPQTCDQEAIFHLLNITVGSRGFKPVGVTFADNGEFDGVFWLASCVCVMLVLVALIATVVDYTISSCDLDQQIARPTLLDQNLRDSFSKSKKLVKADYQEFEEEEEKIVEGESSSDPPSYQSKQISKSSEDSILVASFTTTLKKKKMIKLLLAFSLYTNLPKLISTKQSDQTLTCLQGIRVLSLGWVILGHSVFCMVGGHPPVMLDNGLQVFKKYARWISFLTISNATFAVDTFFVLGAFLLTYLSLQKFSTSKYKLHQFFGWRFYFKRYIRLTPSVAFVILFVVGIFKVLGNNTVPQWQPYKNPVNHCQETWWANLLYVNNFVENYCIGWTWYLACDFQFYAVSPIFMVLMIVWPVVGVVSVLVGMLLCTALCFIISYSSRMGPFGSTLLPEPGEPYSNYDWMFNFYFKPFSHFNAYATGMLLGFFLHKIPPKTYKANPFAVFCCWVIALGMASAALYGIHGKFTGHYPSILASAVYNSLARLSWSIAIAWMVWACIHGYGGLLNAFLSMDIWIPLSRLSYMTYLVHMLVMQFVYDTRETTFNFSLITLSSIFCSNIIFSYAIGFLFVIFFESPVAALDKAFLS